MHWIYLLSGTSSPRSSGPGRTAEQPVERSEVVGRNVTCVGLGPELLDMVSVLNTTVSPIPGNYRPWNQCGSASGPPRSQICTVFASCSQNLRLCLLRVLVAAEGEL